MIFFLLRYGVLVGGILASLVMAHQAFEGWKQGLVDVAIVEQQEEMYAQEMAIRDKQIDILSKANAAIKQEVEQAKNHVQKQNEKIKALKEELSVEVQECLDLHIDSGFVQ